MKKPIVSMCELEFTSFGKGERFEAQRAPVSSEIGAKKLGYAVIKLAPGKRAWPFHSHHVVEEMFLLSADMAPCATLTRNTRSNRVISSARPPILPSHIN